jgi:hypothetical protein
MEDVMEEQVSRADLLKAGGLVTAGAAALSLAMPEVAYAQVPHSTYIQGYVAGTDLPNLQGSTFEVPTVGTGPVQPLSEPGRGFDLDFGEAVVDNNSAKNKGRDPSWCLLMFTHGGYNGFPPVNSGGVDAIRLEGVVEAAVDPSNLGVAVKLYVASGATIDSHHPVCLVKFFFGPFGPWTGRGLAIVNT